MELLQSTADPEALIDRADALLAANRLGAARNVLSAARHLRPGAPRVASLEARLALREGRPAAGIAALDAAIATAPSAELYILRADARRQLGDVLGAAGDAAEAVILDRTDPEAKAMLGVLALEIGRTEDAIVCLRSAVAARPDHSGFREGLATALLAAGRPDDAAAVLADGIAMAPGSVALRNAAILLAVRRRDFAAAIDLAESARVAGVVDASTFGLQGHALSSLGRHDEAAGAYAAALKLGPEDPYVRHLVAASGVRPGDTRAPPDYVRTVFDGYADRFDAHLLALGYRVPGLIRAVVESYLPPDAADQAGPVLDLGCGTGLMAIALSDLNLQRPVGVDLSPRMLERARARGLYADLHERDIVAFLEEDTRSWRLILAADVFCYAGDLRPVLAACQQRLLPGGLLIFSSEELLDQQAEGWMLGRQGRYAHSAEYLTASAQACGFVPRPLAREGLRQEAGVAVPGFIVVLERPPHGA
jgi:predicted TPR repeat methyltransferase